MKKLLGLLAVAPMAIAACGGSTDASFDTVTAAHGQAYGTTHGYTIYDNTLNNNVITVPAGTVLALDSAGVCANVIADDLAVSNLGKKFGGVANGYDVAYSGDAATTAPTFTEATITDGITCTLDADAEITIDTTATTEIQAGLSKANVQMNEAGEVTSVYLDETSGNNFKEYWADNTYTDVYGFRFVSKVDADDWIGTTATTWKRDNLGYMPNDDAEGKWTPTIDALQAYFIGMTYDDAKDYDLSAGWAGDVANASEGMSDLTQYADVIVEAIKAANAAL